MNRSVVCGVSRARPRAGRWTRGGQAGQAARRRRAQTGPVSHAGAERGAAPAGRRGRRIVRRGSDGAGDDPKPAADAKGGGKNVKTKTYTFGAMDVEGKLKTPQLLYFLNRVKLELDMSAPDKRSFMKELGQSADDKSL